MRTTSIIVLGLCFAGLLGGTARAEEPADKAPGPTGTATVKEARVWLTTDTETMKRMGTTPRVDITVKDGQIGNDACVALSKSTKYGRALWQMKGKAHEFRMRAPFELQGKHTVSGTFAIAADGTQTVTECKVVKYEPAKDDAPVWPADAF